MSQTPTLFIGVGGIGCRIVSAINDILDDAHRDYAGNIGVD